MLLRIFWIYCFGEFFATYCSYFSLGFIKYDDIIFHIVHLAMMAGVSDASFEDLIKFDMLVFFYQFGWVLAICLLISFSRDLSSLSSSLFVIPLCSGSFTVEDS